MSSDDAPILTLYLPASAIHAERPVSKDARSVPLMVKLTVCDWPGCKTLVLVNAFNSNEGLSSFPFGAVIYNSTTSFPATLPLLVTVTDAVNFPANVDELNLSAE